MATIYSRLLGQINARRRIPMAVTELYLKTKKYLPKNPVILEAGAHMGFDTYGLCKIWPRAKIYAFEPVPAVYHHLIEKLTGVKNVKTFNLALGDENGSLEMYISGGDSTASSSILKPTAHLNMFPSVTFEDKAEVPVKRLEDWAKTESLTVIDFLWLDMQGYEVYALKGAGDLLNNVSVIYTELCKSELYSGLVTQHEYIKFLNGVGFELISISEEAEVSEGIFINRNAIVRRKKLSD